MAMRLDAERHYQAGLQAVLAQPADYAQAMTQFRAAAIRGHAQAQKQLGRLYASVTPAPDRVSAYLWLYLAARNDAEAASDLRALAPWMTRAQIDAAQALAAGFVPGRAPDGLAAAAASAAELASPETITEERRSQRRDLAPASGDNRDARATSSEE